MTLVSWNSLYLEKYNKHLRNVYKLHLLAKYWIINWTLQGLLLKTTCTHWNTKWSQSSAERRWRLQSAEPHSQSVLKAVFMWERRRRQLTRLVSDLLLWPCVCCGISGMCEGFFIYIFIYFNLLLVEIRCRNTDVIILDQLNVLKFRSCAWERNKTGNWNHFLFRVKSFWFSVIV